MLSRIKLRDRVAVVVMFAVCSAFLIGCGGSSSNTSSSGAEAKPGGTLTIGLHQDPESLTPAESLTGQAMTVISQMNQTLFTTNEAGELKPLLAEKMTTSPDRLTSTIKLKSNIKFSNGQPMTSADVVFSIDAARKSTYYSSFYEKITNVSAPNPTTVVIKTKEPEPVLEEYLASWVSAIVPKNYGGVSGPEFSEHPIGTGPFKFKSWAHGESVAMVKNPNYWQSGQPLLNEVVFRILPEDNSRVAQMRGGELDAMEEPPFPQLPGLEQAGFKKSLSPKTLTQVLVLNQNEPLFKNADIRKAIDVAIDRKGIVETAVKGEGEPAGSFLNPEMPLFDSSIAPPTQNTEEAKRLVAAAVKEGVNPSFTLITFSGEAYWSSASQIIQQNLNEVGFHVTLEPMDSTAALARLEESNFDVESSGYINSISDPSELTSYIISYVLKPSGADVTQLESDARRASVAEQPAKRREGFDKVQADVAAERGLISLSYLPLPWVLAPNVVGFEQTPLNLINLSKAGFSS
jgi:peptide/nickel transport system substrate-binding protein